MPVNIRRAIKEDCPRLLELVNELALYEKAPEEVTVTLDHFVESGFGSNPVWWAFVAEEDGLVQGFALYYIRYSTWKGQRMYLEDILVTEQARGKGLGKLLFDQLIEEGWVTEGAIVQPQQRRATGVAYRGVSGPRQSGLGLLNDADPEPAMTAGDHLRRAVGRPVVDHQNLRLDGARPTRQSEGFERPVQGG